MMEGLKPYPAYKDSGVSWLGDVPDRWRVQRIKTVLREVDRRSARGEELLLSMTRARGLIPQSTLSSKGPSATSLVGYKVCQRHQIVMNRMQAWSGMFAVVHEDGIVSPDYAVFFAQAGANANFLVELFKTPRLVDQFANESKGIGSGFNRLYSDRFGALPIPLPPPSEQAAIVGFLDHADRRTRRYISAKRKLIALLNEQKQAIIDRAVTRGLDPNVRLKPSGVKWLGDVPEHWELLRLKFVAKEIVDCLHATPKYSDVGAYPAIRTADVLPGQLLLDRARRVDDEHYRRWTERMAPAEGDILYTREGERFGIAALVPGDTRLCISQRMMAFRIDPRHNSAYVMWQINCQHVYAQAAADLIGSAAPHVNVERIKNFWLAIPPRGEQDEIVTDVRNQTEVLDAAVERAHDEIRLLREFRTRLIADVVTGKLDVREAAANLPDEIEEREELGEAELVDEDEVESVAEEDDAVLEEVEA